MGKAVEDRGPAEDGAHAPSGLPYDPEQWEKRLDRARAKRAEILRLREEGEAPASGPAPPAPPAAKVEPLALQAPADGQADPAASPPVAEPAVRPSTETRWKVIAFACLGVALLCIGIAIGATMAGLRMPIARDAAAPPAIVQDGTTFLPGYVMPEVDPQSIAPPERAVAPPRPYPEPIVVPEPEPDPADVRGTSAVPTVEPDTAPGPAPDVAVAPETGPADGEAPATDEAARELATDVAVAPEVGPSDPAPSVPDEALPETATDVAVAADGNAAEPETGVPDEVSVETAPADATSDGDTVPPEGVNDALRAAADTGLRLIVHAPPSVGAEGRNAVSEALRAADFTVTDPITVNLTISETHLRYYHAEDREAAEAIASLLDIRARDFTAYRPTPQDRIVEIWMEGQERASNGGGGQPASRGLRRPELVDRITRMLRDQLR